MSEWDLGEFLAHRQMPTASVVVYLNEYASYAKVQLLKAQSRATDPEEVADIDAKLAEVEADLEKSKYEIHLEAIPAEMREDIHERALEEFPEKTNFLGQPAENDPQRQRTAFENDLLWAACIRKMVTPSGQEFVKPSKEDVKALEKGLTSTARAKIDLAIRTLHEESERFTAEIKNPDF